MAIDRFPLRTVHPVLHPAGVVRLALGFEGEGDLPSRAFAMVGRCWILHAAVLLGAVPTLQQSTFEVHPAFAVLSFACALVTEGVARRADARQVHRVELEFAGGDDVLPPCRRSVLMVFAIHVMGVQLTAVSLFRWDNSS